MDIVITTVGASYPLRVNQQDTVKTLKIKIQEKLAVPVQNQKLILVNGNKTPLNDDTKLLSWYGVKPGSQVTLLVIESIFQVFLRNEKGQTSTYDVSPDETVQNFKLEVERREKVPVSQQRLLFQSRELSGGRLSDYNITSQSTIELMLRLRGGCPGI